MLPTDTPNTILAKPGNADKPKTYATCVPSHALEADKPPVGNSPIWYYRLLITENGCLLSSH